MLSSTFLKTFKISFSLSFFLPRRTHRKRWNSFKTGIYWVRSYLWSVGRRFSLWRRRVFLLCTQFSFYLFFFLHLNLFRPLPFKFFFTSQHDRINILFWIQCLGVQFSIHLCFQFPYTWSYCPICFSKLWILDLVSCWKDTIFCCKVTVLEAKVFIISRRSSLDDDPITLEFVNGRGGCLTW
jgi:hypothetical protein